MPDSLPLFDPRITAVPEHDRGEPLVDVRTVPALRVDTRMAGVHDSYALLRAMVVDRLVIAQSLLPRGLRLLLVEGYRPPRIQQRHFHECCADLRDGHPDWPDERIEEAARWYCSPAGTAPHPTGAAVDVTLCTAAGIELAMGTEVHAGPVQSGGACATESTAISTSERDNRATLGRALVAVDMVNLPTAWWHWSFGDQYWCRRTAAIAAPYGLVESTPD